MATVLPFVYYISSLGRNRVMSSQNATRKSIATSTARNGSRATEIFSIRSPVTDDITNRQAPTGGVIRDIFKVKTIMIPA